MRRIVCLLAALLICGGLVCPAYGTGFVPSVSRPEKPSIGSVILGLKDKVEEKLEEAQDKIAEAGEVVEGCIVISTVKEAKEKLTDITQEERDTLVNIYEQLFSGEMVLPTPKNEVVLQVLDISWEHIDCVETDHTHKEEMDREETVLVTEFDLGVPADVEVTVLVYVADEWRPVEKVINNGNGTVTTGPTEAAGAAPFFDEFGSSVWAVEGSNCTPVY